MNKILSRTFFLLAFFVSISAQESVSINTRIASVYAEPTTKSKIVFQAKKDHELDLRVTDDYRGWYAVIDKKSSKKGWIQKKAVVKILNMMERPELPDIPDIENSRWQFVTSINSTNIYLDKNSVKRNRSEYTFWTKLIPNKFEVRKGEIIVFKLHLMILSCATDKYSLLEEKEFSPENDLVKSWVYPATYKTIAPETVMENFKGIFCK